MENAAFPKIKLDDGTQAYGGNQAWFQEKAGAAAGCGAVAAANSLAALAAFSPKTAEKFGIRPDADGIVTEHAFRAFMENVYGRVGSGFYFIKPFGIGIGHYITSVLKYAEGKGVCLDAHAMVTTFASYHQPLAFLAKGLQQSGAVALLASWNSYTAVFPYPGGTASARIRHHFVTVTGLRREADGDYQLTVSTWGKKGVISYKEIYRSWQSAGAFSTALVYFTPTGGKRGAGGQILRTPLLIWKSMLRVLTHAGRQIGE